MGDDMALVKEYFKEVSAQQREIRDTQNNMGKLIAELVANGKTMARENKKFNEYITSHSEVATREGELLRATAEKVEYLDRKTIRGNGVMSHEGRIQTLESERTGSRHALGTIVQWAPVVFTAVFLVLNIAGVI